MQTTCSRLEVADFAGRAIDFCFFASDISTRESDGRLHCLGEADCVRCIRRKSQELDCLAGTRSYAPALRCLTGLGGLTPTRRRLASDSLACSSEDTRPRLHWQNSRKVSKSTRSSLGACAPSATETVGLELLTSKVSLVKTLRLGYLASPRHSQVLYSDPSAAYLARHVGHLAGLPVDVPALTVNR